MARFKTKHNSPLFEELEPRLLFSADVAEALATDAAQEQSYEEPAIVVEESTESDDAIVAPDESADTPIPDNNTSDSQSSSEEGASDDEIENISTDDSTTDPEENENDLEKDTVVVLNRENAIVVAPEVISDEQSTSRSELVLINDNVNDIDQLILDIEQRDDNEHDIEIIILDDEQDGIDQVSEILTDRHDLDAIHIITHGSESQLSLGGSLLDNDNLKENSFIVQGWGNALSEDADMLFYGCSIAASGDGQDFMDTIAQLTGADVAASDDATGHDSLGGDWELEYASGTIEEQFLFSSDLQQDWQNLLAETVYISNDIYDGEKEVKFDKPYGQTFFYTDGGSSYDVDSVSVWLRRDSNTETQTVTVSLRTDWESGVLASTTISSDALGTTFSRYDFNFDSISLDQGTTYYLHVITDSLPGKVFVAQNGSDSFADGTWIKNTGQAHEEKDMAFRVVCTNNNSPSITSGNVFTTIENSTAVTTLIATDPENDPLTFSISGGADGELFVIDSVTGNLQFQTAPDFENPVDDDQDGVYELSIQVADNNGGSDSLDIALTVIDLNDPPTSTNISISETYIEDWSLDLTDILVSDEDSADVTVTLTLSDPAAGALNIGTSGSVVSTFDGTVWTASGAINNVNTLLAGVTFTPVPHYNSNFSIDVSIDDGETTVTAQKLITGVSVNDAPLAVDDMNSTLEDTSLLINISDLLVNDIDVDGDTLTFAGFTQTANGTIIDNGDGTLTYTPDGNFNGTDSFVYTVSDGMAKDTGMVSLAVVAVNDAPLAAGDSSSTAENTPLIISTADLLGNDSDVDGDALNITGFTQPGHGSLIDNGNGTLTFTPDVNYNGIDSFVYTVSDGLATDTTTVNLTVNLTNDAPVATDDDIGLNEDEPLVINVSDLLSNDSDSDLDPLNIVDLTQPMHGNLIDNGDGTLTYTSHTDYFGVDSFVYTVSDGLVTDTATVNLTVSPVNDNPLAADDSSSTLEDTSLILSTSALLANDSDVDGDALNVTGFLQPLHGGLVDNGDGTLTYTPEADFHGTDSFIYTVNDGVTTESATVSVVVTAVNDAPLGVDDNISAAEDIPLIINASALLANDTDVDGDPLNITSFTLPGHGTLVDNGDGTFTYTSDANYSGADSFLYTLSDGLKTDTVTVNLTVTQENDFPAAVADTLTVYEGSTTNLNLAINDIDIDDGLDLHSITIISDPGNGTIDSVNADGTVTYTHDGSETFVDSFTYRINDFAGAASNIVTVNLNISSVNDVPIANNDIASGDEDSAITGNVLSNDTDMEGDILTMTLTSDPVNGTILYSPDGNFSYTPNANWYGTDNFTYRVNDGAQDSNEASVTIFVNQINDTPDALDDSSSTTENTSVTTGNVLSNDNLGDETSSITGFDTSSTWGGTVIYNNNGTFTYTPAADFIGTDSFTYTITDNDSETSTATVTVAVAAVVVAPPVDEIVPENPEPETPVTEENDPEIVEEEPNVPEEEQTVPEVELSIVDGDEYVEFEIEEEEVEEKNETPIETPDQTDDNSTADTQETPAGVIYADPITEETILASNSKQTQGMPVEPERTAEIQKKTLFTRQSIVVQKENGNSSTITLLLEQYLDRMQFESQAEYTEAFVQLRNALDDFKEEAESDVHYYKTVVGSAIAVSSGLSVGYVVWMIRGGMLLSSVLCSMPAWQIADPLPLLSHGKDENEEDSETLETIIKDGSKNEGEKAEGEKPNAEVQ